MVHDLTHMGKRHDCEACQAKIKMSPARRKNPRMRERPSGLTHMHLADHLSSSDLNIKSKTSRCAWCFFALVRRSEMSFP